MEINGIAHIQLTVNDLQRAISFYERVLGFMGMKPVVKAPNGLYMIGGRTAVAITRSSEESRKYEFDQRRVGLHHICFRARSREDIDALYAFLVEHNVKVVHFVGLAVGVKRRSQRVASKTDGSVLMSYACQRNALAEVKIAGE